MAKSDGRAELVSRTMRAVRSKDTKAELALRRALHERGVRYRLHARDVVGCPDIVIRSHKFAVFVDGDMWHGNAWRLRGHRTLGDMFPTNTDYWVSKIERNIERDAEVTTALRSAGWTVIRIWESDILTSPDRAAKRVADALSCLKLRH